MKRRSFTPLFVAALMLGLGIIVAACGDNSGLTLEEYFRQVNELDDDFNAQTDALYDAFPEAFEDPAATRDLLATSVPIFRDFIDGLAAINPPAAVEDDHNEAVAAGEAFTEVAEDFVKSLADAESDSELEDLFTQEDPEFTAVENRFEAACLALEGIAIANGIAFDLVCEDDEQ